MLTASLDLERGPARILAIGCHADDVELGCGGTLLALAERRPDLEVTWVVLGAAGVRAEEARSLKAKGLQPVRLDELLGQPGYLSHC